MQSSDQGETAVESWTTLAFHPHVADSSPMGQFRHAPVQRSVRAERHGHLRLLAQADKLFAGDKLSGNELFLGFLQPFLLPVFGLPPLFLFDAFFLLVLLPQTFPVPFAITDQGLGVKAELFVDSLRLQLRFVRRGISGCRHRTRRKRCPVAGRCQSDRPFRGTDLCF